MKELRVLSPTAILGYGFPEESFNEGMRKKPHVIAVDGGSTDPGPHYLGAGYSFTDRNAVKRDLQYMIPAALKNNIPVIVGTSGGSGADSHLQWTVEIVQEIAKELNLNFKLAVISAEIDKSIVKQKFKDGKIVPMDAHAMPTLKDIENSTAIVGQMGLEPHIEALEKGADVILAGRTYDPVSFAALAVKEGFDEGLATHMGKILECAAIASTPGSGSDCMFAYLREDEFELEPLSPIRKCTELSVAAHTLYEKTNPYILPGPGGILNLEKTTFTQNKENSVIVKGSRHIPTEDDKYFVKLESAKIAGYRTVSIASCRDPILVSQIDSVVEQVKEKVISNFKSYGLKDFFLDFKIYGKNGVMGLFKGLEVPTSEELCIIIEAVAQNQAEADTICSFARSTMLHFGYDNRKSTAGNLAFPFSPSDFKVGEVYEFALYHLMEVDSPTEHFPVKIYQCNKGELI